MNANIDELYMHTALQLAARALGRTSPNPVVGAVVVKEGRVIGQGYHKQAGTPHAEVHALREAGEDARGADIYVTLEPCCHYGRTPPCTKALIEAGIKKAVIATADPNPRVAGQGINILNQAGIETRVGVLEQEARRLNEFFFKYIQTAMPFTAIKTAMTLDGKIAAGSGDSRWITSEDARQYVHRLRNVYDAILVGIGTVLKDDPRLNTRLDIEDRRDPLRVVIDGDLEIPLDSQIVQSGREQPTLLICSDQADAQKEDLLLASGVQVMRIPGDRHEIPLQEVLSRLAAINVCSVLVEGGGEINSYLLMNRLADKIYWFIAPKIVGGRGAPSPVGGSGREKMSDALGLTITEIKRFSRDILFIGYL